MRFFRLALMGTFLVAVMLIGGPRANDNDIGQRAYDHRPGSEMPEKGLYARSAMLRPLDDKMTEFEAGYTRHLEWHKQAQDPWAWYGWTISHGDRTRWFVYATFGHASTDFDQAVDPVDDERDSLRNVAPHCEFMNSALFEYLPKLSHGNSVPTAAPRAEMLTVEVAPASGKALEAALAASGSNFEGETLWYRLVGGGASPRYVRLRPRRDYAAIFAGLADQPLSDAANRLAVRATVEVLTLRPTMSYGLPTVVN
jgi:hypothetical protein